MRKLEEFYAKLNDNPDTAFYGVRHVNFANEQGAIQTLLVTDSLFRHVPRCAGACRNEMCVDWIEWIGSDRVGPFLVPASVLLHYTSSRISPFSLTLTGAMCGTAACVFSAQRARRILVNRTMLGPFLALASVVPHYGLVSLFMAR